MQSAICCLLFWQTAARLTLVLLFDVPAPSPYDPETAASAAAAASNTTVTTASRYKLLQLLLERYTVHC